MLHTKILKRRKLFILVLLMSVIMSVFISVSVSPKSTACAAVQDEAADLARNTGKTTVIEKNAYARDSESLIELGEGALPFIIAPAAIIISFAIMIYANTKKTGEERTNLKRISLAIGHIGTIAAFILVLISSTFRGEGHWKPAVFIVFLLIQTYGWFLVNRRMSQGG